MSAEKLLGSSYLGNGINMASLKPDFNAYDYESVLKHSSLSPIVNLDEDNKTDIKHPGSEKEFYLPGNATYDAIGTELKNREIVTGIGKDIIQKLKDDVDFGVNYSGIGLPAGAQTGYGISLKATTLYAAYSFENQIFATHLDEPKSYGFVNSDMLAAAEKLPEWKPDSGTWDKYCDFFEAYGTHLITRSYVGNRYQLLIEQAAKDVFGDDMNNEFLAPGDADLNASLDGYVDFEDMVSKFTRKVKAEFKDVIAGIDGDWVNEYHKNQYLKTRKITCHVRGGNPSDGEALSQNPKDDDAFMKWIKSRDSAYDGLISFQIQSLSTFLENSPDSAHQAAGRKLRPALDYCCNFAVLEGKFWAQPRNKMYLRSFECQMTDLPGLEVKEKSDPKWEVDSAYPWLRLDRISRLEEENIIDLIVVAPPAEVEVKIKTDSFTRGSETRRMFGLSPGGLFMRQNQTLAEITDGTQEAIRFKVSPSLGAWGKITDIQPVSDW